LVDVDDASLGPLHIVRTELDLRTEGSAHPRQRSQPRPDRLGTADEVAKAALFLASDDFSFVAAIELFVDGGSAAAI
jgi:NAD(P)-dependent dehydrogenase (short-subunit alcohol dehydrogenase family)